MMMLSCCITTEQAKLGADFVKAMSLGVWSGDDDEARWMKQRFDIF
jgi:hypothetical protein